MRSKLNRLLSKRKFLRHQNFIRLRMPVSQRHASNGNEGSLVEDQVFSFPSWEPSTPHREPPTNPLAMTNNLWFNETMNRRLAGIFLIILVIALVVLISPKLITPSMPTKASPAQTAANTPLVVPTPPSLPPPPPLPIPTNPATTSRSPEEELQQVSFTIENFRKSIGSNPVGANAEITRSLLGDNEKQLQVGLPDGVKQNESGEMIDRWGTAYFFHQQSATEMEIRSAGPDRKLWTDDDLQIK